MLEADSCTGNTLSSDGLDYARVRFGSEAQWSDPQWKALGIEQGDRCGDCGVSVGGLHHLDCDMEECPKCKGQLIECCGMHASGPHLVR